MPICHEYACGSVSVHLPFLQRDVTLMDWELAAGRNSLKQHLI